MSAFGRALAIHDVRDGIRIGEVVDVTGEDYTRAYHLKPLGRIAARKPASSKAGEVATIGIEGANNHVSLWKQRQVYR
jgi:hypothetical protein